MVAIYPEQSETDYPDGSPETTTYADYYYSNSLQVNEVVTTSPTVWTAQEQRSREIGTMPSASLSGKWTRAKFLTENTDYPLTGNLLTTIQDVNTTSGPTDVFYPYQQWNTPTGGGMNAETDYEYDGLGRQIESLARSIRPWLTARPRKCGPLPGPSTTTRTTRPILSRATRR